MNENTRKNQTARNRARKETKEVFAFCIGIDLGDKQAGGQSRWVAELVEQCGHEVLVSNTRKVPYIYQSHDKDDPGDAYKLAELLYLKPRLLHPIQHRSQETQADLSWIRARGALVESRTQLINTVRAISKSFGERLTKCSTESFTAKGRIRFQRRFGERWRRCWRCWIT
jgi:transposase